MERIINVAYSIIVAVVVLMIATIPDGLPYALGTAFVLLVLREVLFLHMRRMRRITEMRNRTRNFYVVGMHPQPNPERQIIIFEDYPDLLTVVPHHLVYKTAKDLEAELEEVGNRNGIPDKSGNRGRIKVRRYIMGEGENAGESWIMYMQRVEREVSEDMQIQAVTEKRINEDWELQQLAGQELGNSTDWWQVVYSGKKKTGL